MDARSDRGGNLLLAQAGPMLRRLVPHIRVVALRHRQMLSHRHDPVTHLLFPHDAMISLVTRTDAGQTIETGLIGREGCVGAEALLGGTGALSDSTVQVPGEARVIPLAPVRAMFESGTGLRDPLLRHFRVLLAQLMQSVACNRLHDVEARCCRWLLMAHDRAGRDELVLTQEFVAEMLGVRRPTVTLMLQALEQAGRIENARSRIIVRDRAALERGACECYGIIRAAQEDVGLGLPVP